MTTIASTPSALMLLLSRNPKLARFQELWSVTSGRHQQVLDLISASHLSQPDWEEIIHAAVRARVPQIARSFLRILGVSAVNGALNICQQYSASLPSDWNAVFGEQTPTVAEWLRFHPDVKASLLSALAQDINPFDSVLLSLGSDMWQAVLDADEKSTQRANAFMLLFGLQNPPGKPYELVSLTFEGIHEAAELERLESATWMILRDSLPVLGWGRDWDVCERLRRLWSASMWLTVGLSVIFFELSKTGRRSNERCCISFQRNIFVPSEGCYLNKLVLEHQVLRLFRTSSSQSIGRNSTSNYLSNQHGY